MNHNLMCNRILCCFRLRFYNFSKTLATKYETHTLSQFSPTTSNFPKRFHCSPERFNEESIEETGEPEDLLSPQKSIILEDYSEQFRNTLYPESDDPLISQLKSCDSIKDLFSTVNRHKGTLTPSHYCQVLLVLYDILHVNNCLTFGAIVANLPESIKSELPEPLSSVILNILDVIKDNVDRLSADELVCCLLYSKRLGVDIKHPSVQTILTKIDHMLLNQDAESFSISALSRLTVVLDNRNELWTKLFLIKTLPLIHSHFDRCRNADEFKALTISMLSTVSYLREELLMDYEALTEEFLRKGIITKENRSVIVKAIMLLNHVYYHPAARHMTYKLLHMLHGQFHEMFLPHLSEIQKVLQQQKEPHDTIMLLNNFKKKSTFLPKHDDANLHFYLPLLNLSTDAKGSQFMKELIAKSNNLDILLNLQTHLTTAMPDVCNMFWSKVAEMLGSSTPLDVSTLIRILFRYLNFSNRMVTYHHRQFESVALLLAARELVDGTTVMQPKKFALLAYFVLTVDTDSGVASLSNDVLSRLLVVISQLDILSCKWVSKGIGDRLRKSKDVHLLLQLDTAMNEQIKELSKTINPGSIKYYNTILRSFISRKQSVESDLMRDAINRWRMLDWSRLTSRSLRNLVYNLDISNVLIPQVVERMVDYCLNNDAYVTAGTVGKLLHMCYHLGYTPTHVDALCGLSADLATRDEVSLNGLSILQVALALSYFDRLPTSLIKIIFTVDFLETLDNEIKHCFAKVLSKPEKIHRFC
ncbi:uncharacterized protein LOC128986816 isoform X2 [Macrosteles quadrilineatus]|uniref:uncharacterized protein LOC128981886 isoform X2 n=1 Tax=Macrosteles quadrilineatus TaxID=74068 RepID=UPI0023E30495|nr:uncharacterized protein LOC128981886 isoform X2 [Macrosteles quadrilineatus]XP_054263328.1 uncharacterized protein LOC128986816 isoform X2 [Macrosteles quadrilineatus]